MIIGYLQVAGMPNSGLEANAVADEWHFVVNTASSNAC